MRTHIASEPPIICKHQAAVRAIGERVLPRTRIVRRKVDKRVKEIRVDPILPRKVVPTQLAS